MNAHAAQTGAFLLEQFVTRHWLIGVENGLVTLGLGLALAALLSRLALFKPTAAHGLRGLIALVALYKTALYFVLGEAMSVRAHTGFGIGFQLPGPQNLVPWDGSLPLSIWHPTALSKILPVALFCYALARLLLRVWQVTAARHAIARLAVPIAPADRRALALSIGAAAGAIGKRRLRNTPAVVIGAGFGPTPFVLGAVRPCIVIDVEVLRRLRGGEDESGGGSCLEAAMRHELAHLARADHLLRWVQAWLADVAGITLLGPCLSAWATRCAEQVCDSVALRRAEDAPLLSRAIMIATEHSREGVYAPAPSGPTPAALTAPHAGALLKAQVRIRAGAPYFEAQTGLPGLLSYRRAERDALVARLRAIALQASGLRRASLAAAERRPAGLPQRLARGAFLLIRVAVAALLLLLLAVVFYVKVFCWPA